MELLRHQSLTSVPPQLHMAHICPHGPRGSPDKGQPGSQTPGSLVLVLWEGFQESEKGRAGWGRNLLRHQRSPFRSCQPASHGRTTLPLGTSAHPVSSRPQSPCCDAHLLSFNPGHMDEPCELTAVQSSLYVHNRAPRAPLTPAPVSYIWPWLCPLLGEEPAALLDSLSLCGPHLSLPRLPNTWLCAVPHLPP